MKMITSSSIVLFISLHARYSTSFILSNLVSKTASSSSIKISNNKLKFVSNTLYKNKQCYRSSYTTKTTSSYTFLSLDNDGNNEEDSDNKNNNTKTITSTWDIKGLKKENQRVILRCVKKIQKASIRLRNAQEQIEKLLENDDTTLEEFES